MAGAPVLSVKSALIAWQDYRPRSMAIIPKVYDFLPSLALSEHRLRVTCGGIFLHNIDCNQFVDSPEYEAAMAHNTEENFFQVRLMVSCLLWFGFVKARYIYRWVYALRKTADCLPGLLSTSTSSCSLTLSWMLSLPQCWAKTSPINSTR